MSKKEKTLLEKLNEKYFALLKEKKFKEANDLAFKIRKIKNNTKKLKGIMKLKTKAKSIFGSDIVSEYVVKPKPNGVGFDVWQDGRKITRGNSYLPGSSFDEAKKELLTPNEYQFEKKLLSIKIIR